MKRGHRSLIGVLVAVVLALLATRGQGSLAANSTIYVDAEAPGPTHDGSSWANAYTDLQLALDAAEAGDEIWVAAGTYKPSVENGGSGDRYWSFQLMNGIALYGGFDPPIGDDAWEERDWEANPTILSGDIGIEGDESDNSYHVFYHPAGTDLESSAILDGFTITGGNADGDTSPHRDGGGMYNEGSSPMLANCTFSANSATYNGGAMFNGYSSSPTLANCTLEANSAGSGAGLYNANVSWPVLTNCSFLDNSADYGGGMFNDSFSSPSLTNITFAGNSANNGGGMFNYGGSSPVLTNCTFEGNSATWWGGAVFNAGDSSPVLTNCTFEGNSATWGGGAVFNAGDSSPVLTNCILWGDTSPEVYNEDSMPVVTYSDVQGGYSGEGNINADPLFVDATNCDYHLSLDSPCIDAGDNEASALPDHDFEGDRRILDGDGNVTRIVDMGVDEVAIDWPYFYVYLPLVLRAY